MCNKYLDYWYGVNRLNVNWLPQYYLYPYSNRQIVVFLCVSDTYPG